MLTNDVRGVCLAKKKRLKGCNMKKMFLMLAVMLLVSTAYAADVTISCSVDGDEVTVNYSAATAADTPRGMGLNIALSSGTITAVTQNTSNGYWVYPGSIDVEGAEYNGTPVAAGGVTYDYMIIEMGALHSPTGVGNGPAQSGEVIKFTVDPDGSDSDITISADATRGGVVKYDATEADVTYTGCTVIYVQPLECLKDTAPEYAAWDAWDKPKCWCYPRQCRGDADGIRTGLYWVTTPDLNLLKAAYNKNDTALRGITNGICADFDHAKTGLYRVTTPDLNILKTYYNKSQTNVPCCDLDQNCTLDAGDKWNFWEAP